LKERISAKDDICFNKVTQNKGFAEENKSKPESVLILVLMTIKEFELVCALHIHENTSHRFRRRLGIQACPQQHSMPQGPSYALSPTPPSRPPLQIIGCFGFSKYIVFATYLEIGYI